jgi:hypothetical protein
MWRSAWLHAVFLTLLDLESREDANRWRSWTFCEKIIWTLLILEPGKILNRPYFMQSTNYDVTFFSIIEFSLVFFAKPVKTLILCLHTKLIRS